MISSALCSPFNLTGLILCPIAGVILAGLIPEDRVRFVYRIGLCTSLFTFLCSLLFWIRFHASTADFQAVEAIRWLPDSDAYIVIGIDGLSLFFVVLTTFLIPTCFLVGWSSIPQRKEYTIVLLVSESILIAVFCMLDLLLFYVFFESVLIPLFLLIGIWGSRERKIKAAYQFFLYTLLGSVFMLLAILIIFSHTGTTDVPILLTIEYGERRQLLLWMSFFASFSGKVPMVPVHIWLPEAHVEAPTAGSVILAGILLKLGTYGLLRFNISMCPVATLYFTPLIYGLTLIAIVYTSLTTLRQIDLKRNIAYSSVAHMNLATLGMFSLNIEGIEGSLYLMLSHGLVSSALFLCVAGLYDRCKTRLLTYYGGLVRTMPILSAFFLFFTLANMSLPGTSSFIGEFLVFVGVFARNHSIAGMGGVGIMIIGAAYSLWLYTRVACGQLKPQTLGRCTDVQRREAFIYLPFIAGVIWMGVYPDVYLECLHASLTTVVQQGAFELPRSEDVGPC
uniref:NADH-ubiquinone oxidoreductase chain 4 n=1 Tax=Selaginella moellendorffii TaxID=88036 RepID=F2YI92_SELML|nr:NADH dehydrogenase subunit 4 [Selaginella moellendorffii]AEA29877.1 NADH dehydrogenase subunit 4 [Selaginella moellendorffii]